MRLSALLLGAFVLAGCGSSAHVAATHSPSKHTQAVAVKTRKPDPGVAQRALRLPPVPHGPLPGYLLIADRNNNRAIIVSPSKRIVWERDGLRGPDDTFFTPGYRGVITNEEFNDTLTQVSLKTKNAVWRYGHDGVPGSSSGYLNTPDDAYRLPNGDTTVADIKNCRVVVLSRTRHVRRILGGSCVHDPPRGFASPNGDTPLPDGGLLVTEIGGWIDRLTSDGRLAWSIRSPVSYPSDAQLLPNGNVLVAAFTDPGKIVEVTRSGRVTWSFGSLSGPDRLNKPSLAVRLPNGLVAATDDWNHRVIIVDPRTNSIVWQYGRTGVSGLGAGMLNKPDGLDLLPSAFTRTAARRVAPTAAARVALRRIGTLPFTVTKSASVALANGKLMVLGGEGTDRILAGPPSHMRVVGHLPGSTHDAAAVLRGSSVLLYGGGEAVSTPAVVRIDSRTAAAHTLHPLDEPLSDLGAASLQGRTYLVGGYTGTQYASAILRVGASGRTTTAGRLPAGTRYAGVATSSGKIYVAGGLTTQGRSAAIYAFEPHDGSVVRVGSLPGPEAHAALAALGGNLYLFGGTSVLRISPGTGAVALVATLPRPLTDPDAVTIGNRIVVLGGGTNAVYALTARG